MRIAVVCFVLAGVVGTIGAVFWHQELQYLLPTPIPKNYQVVVPSDIVRFDSTLIPHQVEKPKLLHFFSPDCPCSRFNLKHFLSLHKIHAKNIEFYVVISDRDNVTSAKYMVGGDVPIVVDQDEKLAKACGVYSTPQAALIEKNNQLYFRGNYNRSRFCTDRNSNFVQMAIDSLILQKEPPQFTELATQSYGCSITEEKDFFSKQ